MRVKRLLLPIEWLSVMGISVFDGRPAASRSSIELMATPGQLCSTQLMHLLGNSMHQTAIGAVVLFVLAGTDFRHANDIPVPAPISQGNDPDENDDDGGAAAKPKLPRRWRSDCIHVL